jgi:pyrroline-5-carboxylate reductase
MTYGFIGLGNMASAIIRGMRASENFAKADIYGFDIDLSKSTSLILNICKSSAICVHLSDVIVLAVKPQTLESVLQEISPYLGPDKLLVSIAAGKPIQFYETRMGRVPFVRVMPNINANVSAAACAVCGGSLASPEHIDTVKKLFSAVGCVYELPESMFPAFGAIAGAAPAYAYMFVDALASAGVKAGIPKPLALNIAADTVLGSAKMIKESGAHPMELVDRVCSPSGTTIEGMHKLREKGFESAVYAAIEAVIEKDKKL